MLRTVGRLARAGFALHWLHPKSKRPIGEDWAARPVASIAELERTWQEGNNVGVRLGEWSKVGNRYLHAIDMDIRVQRRHQEAKDQLHSLFPKVTFHTFPTVVSGSGGASRHFYFLSDLPFRSKKLAHSREKTIGLDNKVHWEWEIELFGTGKQVAIPPSIHPDTNEPYKWEREFDFDAIDLGIEPFIPSDDIARLIDLPPISEIGDIERPRPLMLDLDTIEGILRDLPKDFYCEDRDGWLTVGMALHHEFSGNRQGYELWTEFSKASEKFDARDQQRVWKSFDVQRRTITTMRTLVQAANDTHLDRLFEDYTDRQDDVGNTDAIEFEDFSKVSNRQAKLNRSDVEHELGHIPKRIRKLNEKHAVARVAGKTLILDFNDDGSVSYGSVGDLHALYENDRVATDKGTEPVSKMWMRSRFRRTYPAGIVFAPQGAPETAYNHWQGFAVEPDPHASCSRLLNHIRHVLCNDSQRSYDYTIGWLAHMIQRPADKPGVALVIRGKIGVGKDTLGDYVGGLFPHHHIKIANHEQLTGKFNAHQEKCLLLHVEEGFWAGNKNDLGPLKHLITSDKVLIEPKGVNPFPVQSVLRLFMTSNEKWVVPAAIEERRYFVLDANDLHQQDTKYFRTIRNERENGGRAALLHYLQTYNLRGFEVRDVPNTPALAEQKLQGLRNIESWWYGILQDGQMNFGLDAEQTPNWRRGSIEILRDDLRSSYAKWLRSRRFDGDELREFEIGRRLHSMCPSMEECRPKINGQRSRVYRFPDLDICREAFERWIGSSLIWDQD